jgi:gamma-glutamyl:cysteine ligase YbdK (ATP-grasp superfamily)
VETLTSKKDNVMAAQQAKINETLAKIEANKKAKEDAVSLMNYGWDKMKDSVAMFKEEASAKINEMKNGVKEKKESLMPKPEELGMSDSYKALIDSNAKSNAKQEEQLEEQKKTNNLIEELLGVNKEHLTKGLDLKINGQSGSDLQNQLRDLDVQYNGSGNR